MEWREVLSRARQDERSALVAAPATLCLLLLFIGCGPISIALCVGAVSAGYALAQWAARSKGNFLSPLVESLLRREGYIRTIETPKEAVEGEEKKPWADLLVPESVNCALEELVEEMMEQYVNGWYGTGISHDRAFLNEIRYQLRFLLCRLLSSLRSLDLPHFILHRLLPTAAVHVRRVAEAEATTERKSTPSTREAAMAEELREVHYAVRSRQHEVEYLRQLVEFLLPLLLDERRLAGRSHDDDSPRKRMRGGAARRRWPSEPARHFIRELLTHSVLLPLLDVVADPDTIHHLLCLLFDPAPVVEGGGEDPSPRVPFLCGLTEGVVDDLPDSLLQLKLSEILVDARLFSMFRLYLADTGGPVGELKFVADARSIHQQMQKKMSDTSSSQEIMFEVWQLFTAFVHESAPERIPFRVETVSSFHAAIEGNDLSTVDRIVEKTYQEVYNRLHLEHVVHFCQSETFLGHLCGSPPAALDELDELLQARRDSRGAAEEAAGSAEKAFSFTQFRNQLFSAMKAAPSEEEAEEEENGEGEEDVIVETEGEGVEESIGEEEEVEESWREKLPSIDVSLAEEGVEGMGIDLPSPASSTGPPGSTTSSQGESNYELIIDPERRDINRWRISIPSVQPFRDPVNGRIAYAYCIEVQRSDAEEHETRTWNVLRRYNEFYVLEGKLQEFHAESLSFASLPPRKVWDMDSLQMFASHTREFVDQYRLTFAAFLSGLCKQTLLARSDLIFAFLTSPTEFSDTLNLSKLYPFKMVRKMPSKLTRERGQNLRPFLLSLMANALAESAAPSEADDERRGEGEEDSFSSDTVPFSLYSTVYGHNLAGARLSPEKVDGRGEGPPMNWSTSTLDSVLLLALPWLAPFLSAAPTGIRSLVSRCALFLLRLCSRRTFDDAVTTLLGGVLEKALDEANVVSCVQLLQQTLFRVEEVVVTEQEKALRRELAGRRTQQFVEDSLPPPLLRVVALRDLRSCLSSTLHSLQFPVLNKHLSYVLLDRIVEELFPLHSSEHPHPLQDVADE